ncbi:MAG: pyruvate kinase [Candidatus Komeilibacteria bacterium]
MANTKIVATLGPASENLTTIKKLAKAGIDVVRLNFSHGTYANHAMLISNVRKASKSEKKTIAILQDLQGPRIRIGDIPAKGIELRSGKKVTLRFNQKKYKEDNIIPIDLKVPPHFKKNDRILMHDGLVEMKVVSQDKELVHCKVVRSGMILSHKGVNIPNIKITTPVITAKDKKDIQFGLKHNVDWIALSFVGSAQDIIDLRKLIKRYDKSANVKIMAKIERPQAVKNIDSIIEEVDGIMIARGDLGVEMSPHKVPIIQKKIIKKCMAASKPVLVATQMLDSMINTPMPTRAEVSDVANAVIDHTDAVMLSGETAFGKYPVQTVRMMSSIVRETEKSPFDDMPRGHIVVKKDTHYQAVAESVFELVEATSAKAIVVLSRSGFSAQLIARHRPDTKIIALVAEDSVKRQLNIVWGVHAYRVSVKKSLDGLIKQTVQLIKKYKLVNKGSNIVIVTGQPVGRSKHANLMEVYKI